MQRAMVSVRAKLGGIQRASGFHPAQVVGSLTGARAPVERARGLARVGLEPQAVAQAIQGTMQSEDAVDMSLEMLDVSGRRVHV